ncbi:hypothetical protein ACFCX4_11395 [Kitasatospora sp. NPDC056327]|uniref:hypothetical protein n=1 Tax=Kitasatospora sp. NPDC056327 TaxID=3345785 RepID=UPI0035DA54C2
MPTADLSLRDEYAAAVERLAGRTLDALRGVGGAVTPAAPGPGPAPRPVLAAARVLGPDVLAPQLLGAAGPDEQAVLLLAEAHRAFPPTAFPAPAASPGAPAAGTPADHEDHARAAGAALVTAWRDWATTVLLTQALGPAAGTLLPAPAGDDDGRGAPRPGHAPRPEPHAWQAWSVRMAQLSALALPGLDGPVHDAAREHRLDLARGAVRSLLRCDHRVAARLTRWLAWLAADGRTLPLEVEPMLERILAVGDGSARTTLELAVAERLLSGES